MDDDLLELDWLGTKFYVDKTLYSQVRNKALSESRTNIISWLISDSSFDDTLALKTTVSAFRDNENEGIPLKRVKRRAS